MGWRPSRDARFARTATNPLWAALEGIYDEACAMASLSFRDDKSLDRDYVHRRKGDGGHDLAAMMSRLPAPFHRFRIGPTEADLIDFFLNYRNGHLLNILGFRGAGKSTLLHYAESVMRRALPTTSPVVMIIDCLPLGDQASTRDLAKSLQVELEDSLVFLPETFAKATEAAIASLQKRSTAGNIEAAIRTLKRALAPEERQRLVLAFDNLDHLCLDSVSAALVLARKLVTAVKITCVTCLRPGTLNGAIGRGDPQPFFGYQLRIHPPNVSAWLESLAPRISEAALAWPPQRAAGGLGKDADDGTADSTTQGGPRAYGRELTHKEIEEVVGKLSGILQGRKADDDPIGFLDALTADDMRHLVKLFRRMLSHRHLPGEALLGLIEPPDFHPLSAMFEGQNVWFQDDEFVPNVLFQESRDGPPDFLLPHRILTLLNEGDRIDSYALLRMLEALGIARVDAIACLDRLHRTLLVRCSDSEAVDMTKSLPSDLWLTAAGALYVNHVFSLGDYLLAAIVDVPLRHDALLQSAVSGVPEDAFPPRLHSLIEYANEVKIAEDRQIDALLMRARESPVRRAIDSLRRGGLLTRALTRGFEEVVTRRPKEPKPRVERALRAAEEAIPQLREWLSRAERRLQEGLYGQPDRQLDQPWSVMRQRETEVQLRPITVGDDLELIVEVRSPSASSGMAVSLGGSSNHLRIAGAVIPRQKARRWKGEDVPRAGQSATLRGQLGSVIGAANAKWSWSGSGVLWDSAPRGRERGVLMVAEEPTGCIQLRLCSEGMEKTVDLGPRVDGARVLELGALLCERVEEALASPSAAETIAAAGVRLREEVLTGDGHALLIGSLGLMDILLLCIPGRYLSVPWEWMWRNASLPSTDTRVVRWPTDPLSGAFRLLRVVDVTSRKQSLSTFGLPDNGSWRKKSPSTYTEFAGAVRTRVLHLVGHWNGKGIAVQNGFFADDALVKTSVLHKPRHVVISACRVAGCEANSNVAIAIAGHSNCNVWAPLVDIRDSQASEIDEALYRHLSTRPGSLERFMTGREEKLQALSTYVQYGLTSASR